MDTVEGVGAVSPQHIPVLYNEIMRALRPAPGGHYIDGTVGAGGHAEGILLASSPDGQLLGLDRDPRAIEVARERLSRFGGRVHLAHDSYTEMASEAEKIGWEAGAVDGIVLDLGLSSMQLGDPARGFSFAGEGPLDMRFDPHSSVTAGDLVNGLSVEDLADVLYRYGEEAQGRRIAQAIVASRPISSPKHLAEVVARAVGGRKRGAAGRIHPATRTFQALRIAVNDELSAVARALPEAVSLLRPGGRLAVISFHSLEDRIVKEFFHRESRDCICPPEQPVCICGHRASVTEPMGRKPISPTDEETARNPRARSAKLRVAERVTSDVRRET